MRQTDSCTLQSDTTGRTVDFVGGQIALPRTGSALCTLASGIACSATYTTSAPEEGPTVVAPSLTQTKYTSVGPYTVAIPR